MKFRHSYNNFIRSWTNKYRAELFVYGEANGVIWDIAVNESYPFNKLFVVGLFDSVTKLSQVQFCSVGEFDGMSFEKVTFNPITVLRVHCILTF